MRKAWDVLVDAAKGWVDDGATSMAAAIAFYTTFSLAPIVVLVTALAGLVFDEAEARGALVRQLARLVGRNPPAPSRRSPPAPARRAAARSPGCSAS